MKKTALFIALFSGMALQQNGLGQSSAPATQQSESTSLLASWFGAGEAGDGVWLGTRTPHTLYFFADSGKANDQGQRHHDNANFDHHRRRRPRRAFSND